ncbi:hypothetical protein AB2T85_02785 [Clostridium butyricum]|uniref:hypothetical protein n=1 Tax=Clostridium butyricum TaxID=1492 RepID=UPI003467D569
MNLFNEIYNLTYLPLLTPYNLIDTLKLDNYISLNMHKGDLGIVSEITCLIDGLNITFYYEFDEKDHLLKTYYYEDNNINYLFNREDSINKLKDEYYKIESRKIV